MIAYDLDGIFVNDLHITDNLENLLKIRTKNLKPLFQPKGEYVIITGRPIEDKEYTMKWIESFFTNKPIRVYHENTDKNKAKEYKVKVINENPDINVFFESEKEQAEWINNNTNITVHHFETFIKKAIYE